MGGGYLFLHVMVCVRTPGGPPPPPAQDDTAATKKYKGVHFGNLKSLRTQFKGKASGVVHACRLLILTHMYMCIPAPTPGKDGPGPGDYDLCQDSGRNSPAKVQQLTV